MQCTNIQRASIVLLGFRIQTVLLWTYLNNCVVHRMFYFFVYIDEPADRKLFALEYATHKKILFGPASPAELIDANYD